MCLRAFDVITVYQCNYIGTQEVFQVTAGDTAGHDAHYTGTGGLTQRSIIEWAWYHQYSVGLRWSIAGGRKWRDRKSTRLNSSHANISYAVFCLKQKKSKLTAND